MTTGKGRRVSLWALPAHPAPFEAMSGRLAAAAGVAPVPPHITLDPAVQIDASFAVTLSGVADSDHRHRCIILTAAPAPQLPPGAHLSLLYGAIPAAARAALRSSVDVALPVTITVDALAWVDTTDDDHTKWSEVERLPLRPAG